MNQQQNNNLTLNQSQMSQDQAQGSDLYSRPNGTTYMSERAFTQYFANAHSLGEAVKTIIRDYPTYREVSIYARARRLKLRYDDKGILMKDKQYDWKLMMKQEDDAEIDSNHLNSRSCRDSDIEIEEPVYSSDVQEEKDNPESISIANVTAAASAATAAMPNSNQSNIRNYGDFNLQCNIYNCSDCVLSGSMHIHPRSFGHNVANSISSQGESTRLDVLAQSVFNVESAHIDSKESEPSPKHTQIDKFEQNQYEVMNGHSNITASNGTPTSQNIIPFSMILPTVQQVIPFSSSPTNDRYNQSNTNKSILSPLRLSDSFISQFSATTCVNNHIIKRRRVDVV